MKSLVGSLVPWLAALARGLLRVAGWLGPGWRWPAALALLGCLLPAVLMPRDGGWESRAEIVMRPRILLEGYVLATSDLGRYYAQRFASPARLARAMQLTGLSVAPTLVEAEAEPGTGFVTLRVRHADAAAARALATAMQRDFYAELQRENGTRGEQDRLWLDFTPAPFAHRVERDRRLPLLLGATGGALLGSLIALARGYRAEQRVATPLDAEALTGASTLAAIPWRGR